MNIFPRNRKILRLLVLLIPLFLLTSCAGKSDLLDQTIVDWIANIDRIYDAPLPFFAWNEGDFNFWGTWSAPLVSLAVFAGLVVSLVGYAFKRDPRAYTAGFVIMFVSAMIYAIPAIYTRIGQASIQNLDPPLTLRLAAQAENWPGHDGALISAQTITEGDLDWISAVNGMMFTYSGIPMLHKLHFMFSLLMLLVGLYAAAFSGGKLRWLLIGVGFLLFNFLFPQIFWGILGQSAMNDGVSDGSIWATLLHWNLTYILRVGILIIVILIGFPILLGSVISATVHLDLQPFELFGVRINNGDDTRSPFERLRDGRDQVSSVATRLRGKKAATDEEMPDPRTQQTSTTTRDSQTRRRGDGESSQPSASTSTPRSPTNGGGDDRRAATPRPTSSRSYEHTPQGTETSGEDPDSEWGGTKRRSNSRAQVSRPPEEDVSERRPVIIEGEARDVPESEKSADDAETSEDMRKEQAKEQAKQVARDMTWELLAAFLKGGA